MCHESTQQMLSFGITNFNLLVIFNLDVNILALKELKIPRVLESVTCPMVWSSAL